MYTKIYNYIPYFLNQHGMSHPPTVKKLVHTLELHLYLQVGSWFLVNNLL